MSTTLHGASRLTKQFPLQCRARNARMMPIPDGTTQIHQLIIGRALTGLRAFA